MRYLQVKTSRRRNDLRRSRRLRPDLAGWSCRLEDRALLSTITVTTTSDEFDVASNVTVSTLASGGADGTISLREALIAATNTAGATEVDLPAGTYNLGNVGTKEIRVGNIANQTIAIKGLGTPGNTVINQTLPGNRIFNFDNDQVGTIAASIANVTLQGASNVNRIFGGGAIVAGGPGDSLTLTNDVFQNNSTTNAALGISRVGGAISYSGGGNLTISDSTFTNNSSGGNTTAGGLGGAIAYNNSTNPGLLSITRSTFTNNSATGHLASAGALFVGGVGTFPITATTFVGNSAGTDSSTGGAIAAGGGTININKGRFFNNSASSGSGIDNTGATINANDNWWGADAFPGSPGTDTVATTGGTTTVAARLALALAAAPSSIGVNSSSTLTAKIVSTSDTAAAVVGTALEGLSLTFAPGTLGSVNPTSVPIAGGTASTAFSSGSTLGTTSPTVKLDNGTKSTSITIVGAPSANSQTVDVSFNTATAITLTGSDPNSPPRSLTYSVTANPSHGTLSGTAPNLTYTPNSGYHGSDLFSFKVNNGFADSNIASVSLKVAAGVPTANKQTVAVAFGSATSITLTGSDPDVPALALTYAVTANPSHGTLSGTAPNLTYTPNAGYNGPDSFAFTASNGTNASAPATVTIHVAPGTPTANDQAVSVSQDGSKAITLTGSDPDVPALALTYAVTANPSHGTLSGTAPNLTYTPNAGYNGPDSFAFTASNGTNTSPPGAVSITVNPAVATVSAVSASWGVAGNAVLQTAADGLRLLPSGRTMTIPWLNINRLQITLDHSSALSAGDVSVTGVNVANYGPVVVSGSGTSYTLTLAQPIAGADRVTVTIGNATISTFTRRLDVLPGDVTDNGVVDILDVAAIRNEIVGLDPNVLFGDINGDGVVDINDYNAARRRIGTRLPA